MSNNATQATKTKTTKRAKALPAQAPELTAREMAEALLPVIEQAFINATTKPRRGRPTVRTYEEVRSSIGWLGVMEEVVAGNALVSYLAHAMLRRDLTEEERKEVAESSEAIAQGTLPCGDPGQGELFLPTAIRVTHDDTTGEQWSSEVSRMADMAKYVAFREKKDLYIRFVPNVIVRSEKGAGRWAMRARYGGRLYISDRSEHTGTLLYIVQGTNLKKNSRWGILHPQTGGLPK